MAQKFGPWEDAVTREAYQRVRAIVEEYRTGGSEQYLDADEALQAIAEVYNETEGTDL